SLSLPFPLQNRSVRPLDCVCERADSRAAGRLAATSDLRATCGCDRPAVALALRSISRAADCAGAAVPAAPAAWLGRYLARAGHRRQTIPSCAAVELWRILSG